MKPGGPVEAALSAARRARQATGFSEVAELSARVTGLEEAMDENLALEAPLAQRVAELEQLLVPALAQRHRRS